ncbi:MAG: patatin-like phospholipase family protein, partial [Nannocystaceae bacterium]
TILETMDGSLLDQLRVGPEIRVLLALTPSGRSLTSSLLAGLVSYKLDAVARRRVHPSLPHRVGFQPTLVSVRDCSNADELADLILHSSALPPLIPVGSRSGRRVIDGGIVDGALVDSVADHDSTLVMLTKPHAKLPRDPKRTYVQPSEPVPIAMWDYASPQLIGPTYDLGRRDGEAFVRARAR